MTNKHNNRKRTEACMASNATINAMVDDFGKAIWAKGAWDDGTYIELNNNKTFSCFFSHEYAGETKSLLEAILQIENSYTETE